MVTFAALFCDAGINSTERKILMDMYEQQIKKENDRCLMINYFVMNVMFESFHRENRDDYIATLKTIYAPVMHLFSRPLTDEDYEFLADMPLSVLLKYAGLK